MLENENLFLQTVSHICRGSPTWPWKPILPSRIFTYGRTSGQKNTDGSYRDNKR